MNGKCEFSEERKDDKKLLKIVLSDYEVSKTIGTGAYGRVKLAKGKHDNNIYALKMMKKKEIINLKQVDHIYSEYQILSQINHQFIVNLIGISQDASYLYYLLEYIPGGELFTILRIQENFNSQQAQFYASQIVLIFDYLHSLNIVYRDLKPENILINSNGYLKLTDFGFAKAVEDKTFTICGTPEYLAPEIVMNKGHSKPADWWTLGILLYEMLVGIDPFNDDDPMNVFDKIIKGKYYFPENIDSAAKSLIKKLLEPDISKRYGCLKGGTQDIIESKWFKDFDWQSLISQKIQPPYKPKLKHIADTSNFSDYPESEEEAEMLNPNEDPFLKW